MKMRRGNVNVGEMKMLIFYYFRKVLYRRGIDEDVGGIKKSKSQFLRKRSAF